jgi:hypothetical protein
VLVPIVLNLQGLEVGARFCIRGNEAVVESLPFCSNWSFGGFASR